MEEISHSYPPIDHPRIGVIGAGWWSSTQHIPSLKAHPQGALVAVADTNEDRLRAVAEHFEVPRQYRDHRDLLADSEIDGVMVAVPHALHHEVVRAALEAGKHVFVEKPMVLRAAEAWGLVELARARERHLTVGYTQHYTTHARLAYDLIRNGRLGELRFVSGLFSSAIERLLRPSTDPEQEASGLPPDRPDPESYSNPSLVGGGMGQAQITHPMGLVFWVTGARATEVSAFMEPFDLAVDLADAISYRFDNGAVGMMGGSATLRPGQPRQQELRYYGSEGVLLHDLLDGRLAFYGNDGTVLQPPDLEGHDALPKQAPARAFVDLLRGTAENLAPAEVGAACVEFLEAAYRSSDEGRPVAIGELDGVVDRREAQT